MENKYYTPEINEFHVGFRCEVSVTVARSITEIDYEWHPIIFGNKDTVYEQLVLGDSIVSKNVDVTKYRVKYLDKEDIESFGFTQLRDDTFEINIPYYRGRNNLKCHIIFRKTILLCLGDNETCFSDWETLFTGIIKNKSELNRLLQQLELFNESDKRKG